MSRRTRKMTRLETPNAAQVAKAMGFNELVTKSGYLTKRAKQSARNWKKRYFVLSGHSIMYYENNKNLTAAKGNFLLTNSTTVSLVEDNSYPHCFEISSEFESMRVSAKDPEEAEDWIDAIAETVAEISASTRAYMEILEPGLFGNRWQRRFCMIQATCISYHQDHMHTFKTLGSIKLSTATSVASDGKVIYIKEDGKKEYTIRPSSAEKNGQNLVNDWKELLDRTIRDLQESSDLAVKPGETNNEQTVLDGYLKTQISKQKWVPRFFALTTSALYMAEDEGASDAIAVYVLNPSSSVFETNLKPNAFELVTTQQALHVQAANLEETKRWIAELRGIISNSQVSLSDPLLNGATEKIAERYDVHFDEKKPLGIVLERSREWALVKLSNAESSDVTEGSALCAINGESMMLKSYNDAIKLLTGWKPPLTLSFLRGPEKEGWLGKMSRGRRRKTRNWKQRYFILKQGKLAYYSMDGETPDLKGCVQLMGSAVSLVQADEVGQNFCFRLVSGVATLIMQAETVEQMMDWATELYHAIAIANGGGYLLDVERQRASQEEAERIREAKARAEEEAKLRQQAAAEAESLRMLKEAEEAQARKEAEEAEAAAQAAKLAAEQDAEAEAEALRREEEYLEKKRIEAELEQAREEAAVRAQEAEQEAEKAQEVVQDIEADLEEAEFEASVQTSDTPVELETSSGMCSIPETVEEDDEENDEDDEGEDVGSITTSITQDEDDFVEAYPSEEEYTRAFSILDSMGTGILNPMQFSNLLRASGVSLHNLHLELSWYNKFDSDGTVGISVKDIMTSIETMRDDPSKEQSIQQLARYIKELGSSEAENFSF